MKTSLEACKGQGSRASLPSPVSFDAIVHCKTRKERRQSGLSRGLQGSGGSAAPHPAGRSHAAPSTSRQHAAALPGATGMACVAGHQVPAVNVNPRVSAAHSSLQNRHPVPVSA